MSQHDSTTGKSFLSLVLSGLLAYSALVFPLPSLAAEESAAKTTAKVEDLHGRMSGLVLRTANSIDSFFGTERHTTFEENRSYIRLRLNVDRIEDSGIEVSPNVKIHLVLPGTMNRVRLVANEEDEEGADAGGRDAEDESSLALRWLAFDSRKTGLSFDLGVRIKDWVFAGFGRLNVTTSYPLSGEWLGRTTDRLYWYTDTGFRNDFRQYFEYTISEAFFFRARTRIQYFEEEGSKLFPEQKFSLFQKVSDRSVLAYEAIAENIPADDSPFDSDEIEEPDDVYTRALLRLRYRVNTLWPWLYTEFWPIMLFPEERDYDLTWAVRFRVEVTFGHVPGDLVKVEE